MPRPTLIVVCGPPGSGKTTLAHELARAIGCPAICRDAIKEGIVHAEGIGTPEWGGPISKRTFDVFYATLRLLLQNGVTVVAEGAFRKDLFEADARPLLELANARLVRCVADHALARERFVRRIDSDAKRGAAHPDATVLQALDSGTIAFADFDGISLDGVPTLDVDTTDGYAPSLDEIVAFISD